eukprot:358164-Chlamydomonas_euryale.AAC.7
MRLQMDVGFKTQPSTTHPHLCVPTRLPLRARVPAGCKTQPSPTHPHLCTDSAAAARAGPRRLQHASDGSQWEWQEQPFAGEAALAPAGLCGRGVCMKAAKHPPAISLRTGPCPCLPGCVDGGFVWTQPRVRLPCCCMCSHACHACPLPCFCRDSCPCCVDVGAAMHALWRLSWATVLDGVGLCGHAHAVDGVDTAPLVQALPGPRLTPSPHLLPPFLLSLHVCRSLLAYGRCRRAKCGTPPSRRCSTFRSAPTSWLEACVTSSCTPTRPSKCGRRPSRATRRPTWPRAAGPRQRPTAAQPLAWTHSWQTACAQWTWSICWLVARDSTRCGSEGVDGKGL